MTLFERDRMGGDCLNTGCVPSKSLIAAAHLAQTVRTSGRFGVNGPESSIDFAAVHEHVHGVIVAIEPNDSLERFEGLGVTVVNRSAHFVSSKEVEADGVRYSARRFVIATGSRASIPPIPGIDSVPVLTSESIFELIDCPEHLHS